MQAFSYFSSFQLVEFQRDMNKKSLQIDTIKKEIFSLEASPLYAYRMENGYQPVIGEGSLETEVVFIGEAPGKNEALSGRPFCGRAGKVLDELLPEAGLERSAVYITNIVKDRPPNNRRPTPREVDIYSPFLIKQIEIIQPKMIITLGITAASFMFTYLSLAERNLPFGDAEGKVINVRVNEQSHLLYPLYHPAYGIYQRAMLPKMREDFRRIPELLRNFDQLD